MTSKLKNWILPLSLVLLLILGLVFFRDYFSGPERLGLDEGVSNNPLASLPAQLLNADQKKEVDQYAIGTAMRSGSLLDCELIRFDSKLKEQCQDTIQLATTLGTQNPDCKLIQDDLLRQECDDHSAYKKGVSKADGNICGSIQDLSLKQNCLDETHLRVARFSQSLEECGKINNTDLKNDCISQLTLAQATTSQSLETCDELTDSDEKERCTQSITQTQAITQATAETKTSPSSRVYFEACKKLAKDLRINCEDSAYKQLAFERLDTNFCSEINAFTKQAQCEAELSWHIDQNRYQSAFETKNINACNLISDADLKSNCRNLLEPTS